VISVCRYFFEPFVSWSWRTELAAAAAAAASSCRVRHGADLCYGIPAETQTIGKGILLCQSSLIGNDGPFNGTLHDGESQESGHLLTLTRVVGVAVAWCARTLFKRFRGLARKYMRFCVIQVGVKNGDRFCSLFVTITTKYTLHMIREAFWFACRIANKIITARVCV